MWDRAILKERAKDNLRIYYWKALAVCVVYAVVTGFLFNVYDGILGFQRGLIAGSDPMQRKLVYSIVSFLSSVSVVVLLLAAVVNIFVGNVVRVGVCRYFMKSRAMGESAKVSEIFWGFSCNSYWNIVKVMFLVDLYTTLWFLLLIVPGIYKAYEYYMIPYILSENPDMDSKDAFALTKEMMDGSRFAVFVMELSFVGWYLLGMCLCLIGMFLVNPYVEATLAELYGAFREHFPNYGLRGYGVGEAPWQVADDGGTDDLGRYR